MKLRSFYIILFFISNLFAQTNSSISHSSVSHKTIKIGEQIQLTYELIFQDDEGTISYIPYYKSIPSFKKNANGSIDSTNKIDLEIIGKFKDTIQQINQHQFRWVGKYTITSWDSGIFVLPTIKISTQKNIYECNSLIIKVLFPTIDKNKDIFDIIEQFVEIEENKTSWFKISLIILGIIIVFILLFYSYRKFKKKKLKQPPKVEQVSLKDRTLNAILELETKKLWQNDKLKEHYIEFSFLIKAYLSEKYDLNLSEKTSFETYILLKQLKVENMYLNDYKKLLEEADLVKFAKSKPNEIEILNHLVVFKQIVISENDAETNFKINSDADLKTEINNSNNETWN